MWSLSQCKYWSIWVCFLYTVVDNILSGSGVTTVSRKGFDPSGLVFSVLNLIWGSMELMYSRNWFLCSVFWMKKMSSTSLLHKLGSGRCADGPDFELHSKHFGHNVAYGEPHSCYLSLFILLTMEQEKSVLEAEPQQGSAMLHANGCSVQEFCILFEFVLVNFNRRVHWHRCK